LLQLVGGDVLQAAGDAVAHQPIAVDSVDADQRDQPLGGFGIAGHARIGHGPAGADMDDADALDLPEILEQAGLAAVEGVVVGLGHHADAHVGPVVGHHLVGQVALAHRISAAGNGSVVVVEVDDHVFVVGDHHVGAAHDLDQILDVRIGVFGKGLELKHVPDRHQREGLLDLGGQFDRLVAALDRRRITHGVLGSGSPNQRRGNEQRGARVPIEPASLAPESHTQGNWPSVQVHGEDPNRHSVSLLITLSPMRRDLCHIIIMNIAIHNDDDRKLKACRQISGGSSLRPIEIQTVRHRILRKTSLSIWPALDRGSPAA
jgi:hypothetical protein